MIKLLSSGFYTSIQDLGRFNYTEFGVPVSGAMDKNLFKLANLLVGNTYQEAQLEMTYIGPKLKFLSSAIIAVTAYKAKLYLNGEMQKINQQLKVNTGDIVEIKNIKSRAYLACYGGLDSELKLGSRSQYQPITKSGIFKKGDLLKLNENHTDFEAKNAILKFDFSQYDKKEIEVYPMPEYDFLDDKQQQNLIDNEYTISNESNRMAYQLKEKISNNLETIASKPVMPGTVQLTPEGKLIILMRDAQVTGGYPRIFQLTDDSLNVLAQKSTNQSIKFKILNNYEIK